MDPAVDRLFESQFGLAPERHRLLAGDGGRRRMVRVMAGEASAVAVLGPDPKENRAFLSYTATFRELGLPVPTVYGIDEDAGVYLLEDLGDTTLFQALSAARAESGEAFPASIRPIYHRVIEWLPRFQVEGGRAVDYGVAWPRAAFDRRSMLWDLNYFKYHFLKLANVPFDEEQLETDFQALVEHLLEADTSHFLYRDFQSRNVMLQEGEPRFIDYQGGRRGALQYDVASLLYDGKAAIPPAERTELLMHYLDVLATYVPVDRERFEDRFRAYVVVRILQAMGAYGYRGFYERKPHFLASVPHAIDNLEHLLETGMLAVPLPELTAVFQRLVADEDLRRPRVVETADGLTLRIASFSYKHGVPEDPSGHGGGYVFDCRGLPNPGREAAYADRTGLDPAVIEHLESHADVHAFFERVRAVVEAHVAAYRARGFTSLQVLFGCTGGQHRSVYMAERLARELLERHPDLAAPVEHVRRHAWPSRAGA